MRFLQLKKLWLGLKGLDVQIAPPGRESEKGGLRLLKHGSPIGFLDNAEDADDVAKLMAVLGKLEVKMPTATPPAHVAPAQPSVPVQAAPPAVSEPDEPEEPSVQAPIPAAPETVETPATPPKSA